MMAVAAAGLGDWLWVVIVVAYGLFSVVGAIAQSMRRSRVQQSEAQQAARDLAAWQTQNAAQQLGARVVKVLASRIPERSAQPPRPPAPAEQAASASSRLDETRIAARRSVRDQAEQRRTREPARTLRREIEAGRELAAAMIAGVIMGPPAAFRPGGHEPLDW